MKEEGDWKKVITSTVNDRIRVTYTLCYSVGNL